MRQALTLTQTIVEYNKMREEKRLLQRKLALTADPTERITLNANIGKLDNDMANVMLSIGKDF